MKAKSNYPAGPVVAFGGFEYVGSEWRDVPVGFENQAAQHPYLEIEQVEPEPVPEPVEPAKPKAKPVRKRAPRKRAIKPKGSE